MKLNAYSYIDRYGKEGAQILVSINADTSLYIPPGPSPPPTQESLEIRVLKP